MKTDICVHHNSVFYDVGCCNEFCGVQFRTGVAVTARTCRGSCRVNWRSGVWKDRQINLVSPKNKPEWSEIFTVCCFHTNSVVTNTWPWEYFCNRIKGVKCHISANNRSLILFHVYRLIDSGSDYQNICTFMELFRIIRVSPHCALLVYVTGFIDTHYIWVGWFTCMGMGYFTTFREWVYGENWCNVIKIMDISLKWYKHWSVA